MRDVSEAVPLAPGPTEERLAARLAALRAEQGWSMDELASRSGISRATLSRLERGETSPTALVLNRLCSVYGRTMSRLLTEVEQQAAAVVRAADQPVWTDPGGGFVRRSLSPPHPGLRAELLQGELSAGIELDYDLPPVPGLEHHVWVLSGRLELTVDGERYELDPGDCLRYRLLGPSRFHCPGPAPARYLIAVVLP